MYQRHVPSPRRLRQGEDLGGEARMSDKLFRHDDLSSNFLLVCSQKKGPARLVFTPDRAQALQVDRAIRRYVESPNRCKHLS